MQIRIATVIVSLAVAFVAYTTVHAQEPNRAGVVVQHGDGEIATACVEFEEPALSGLELLRRSGLDMIYEATAGLTVCSIDGEGCQYPNEDCFCECMGDGPCTYWSYWHLDAETGQWTYSQLGADAYEVKPGTVDGWRWGAGTPGNAPEPPQVTFAEICEPAASPTVTAAPATATKASTVTPGASATTEPASTPVSSLTARSTPTNAPTFTPADAAPSPTNTPPPTLDAVTPGVSTEYLLFGGFVVVLLGIFMWVQRRSQ